MGQHEGRLLTRTGISDPEGGSEIITPTPNPGARLLSFRGRGPERDLKWWSHVRDTEIRCSCPYGPGGLSREPKKIALEP